MIAIIDYGMGNLRSVQKALERVGGKTRMVAHGRELRGLDKMVFPGVGAFEDAMEELKRRSLIEPIRKAIAEGRPFLGLCLGMQLLFDESEEGGRIKGLGIVRGKVKRFPFKGRGTGYPLKVPHMGWNTIDYRLKTKECGAKRSLPEGDRRPESAERSEASPKGTIDQRLKILKGVPDGAYMYFVHSYYAQPRDTSCTITTTDYGIRFASGICEGNVYGFQFHPEKSQRVGLKILANFVRL